MAEGPRLYWVIAQWWPRVEFLKPATLFYYVNGVKLFNGWPLYDMAVLLGILTVAAIAGGLIWQRRDLPL